MPEPGKHKRKSNASSAQANGSSRSSKLIACAEAIVDAISWQTAADAACKILDIPDLETRNGLRKIHLNFTTVNRQLDNLWKQYGTIDRVAGTVALIFSKMCSDALLGDKLMREEDLLSKLIPLLDRGYDCRVLSLQALCTITHHSGREIRLEIAKWTPSLVRILQEYPDESLCAEQVIVIVGHSASAALSIDHPPNRQLVEAIDVPRLLPLLLFQLKQRTASSCLVDHALQFFLTATFRSHRDFLAVPSSVNFLVACTRCQDIQTRSLAVSSLLRMHSFEARALEANIPKDPRHTSLDLTREIPKDLSIAIYQTFGPSESEAGLYRTGQAVNDFSDAIAEYARDRDLLKLSLEIGRIILNSEHFMSGDCCKTESKSADLNLPFHCWLEALPLCSKKLRSKGTPDMLDIADIIDLKYLMLRGEKQKTLELADRAIQRNSKVGYFYYVLTHAPSPDVALCAAKKGLMCPNLTTFVKNSLLSQSAEHASLLGIQRLERSNAGRREWDEGVALLMVALEDSEAFMKLARPDDIGMKMVLCVQPLVNFIIRGQDVSPDLNEFKAIAGAKLVVAEAYARHLGYPVKTTNVRRTRDIIFSRMAAANLEWGEAVARYSYEAEREKLSSLVTESNLSAWLENKNLKDDGDESDSNSPPSTDREHLTHPKFDPSGIKLYRCSWCSNASAGLKKCRGCEAARYCDVNCQRAHWRAYHKTVCRTGTTST
ncbi:hypothetical protein SCHPADRAFT_832329 [Schizopora paradoxa]|uniref:MYND-type domain-containing protein n=1 Tax=Schizopora paradoxa TaxID=27342 RepID=A0A0H2RFF6_9AGAM|nr:hypothetical protein SCHPADRAFT_832329 [Schizopora paradoxa]